jgi:hypothetical protein
MMRSASTLLIGIAALLAVPLTAASQDSPPPEEATDPEPPPPDVETEHDRALAGRIDELEQKIADQDAAHRAEVERLEERIDELEEEQELAADEEIEGPEERFLEVFGFFDLTFCKYFFPDDSAYHIYVPDKSSFMMTNINLYFKSQMTETLSALLELRFSFLPMGNEESWAVEVDGVEIPGENYDRSDPKMRDAFTTLKYRRNMVMIERMHATWSPADWFNLLAGRYLTPYGIWNVEHGSTVVLPARVPYMQIREMMPLAQTGLQAYGRFFPGGDVLLDYAVTVSNGRGPTEAAYDLDENKGVGLKLRLAYEGIKTSVSLGGYGYYGKVTDRRETVVVDTAAQTSGVRVEKKEEFDEGIASADLLVKLFGVRLQAEYIYRYVHMTVPDNVPQDHRVFITGDAFGNYYRPSYVGHGVYGLIAYELPLRKWFSELRVSPYFLYEYNSSADTMPYINMTVYMAGINIQPSPYLVIKLEFSHLEPEAERYGADLQNIAAQMAVSF